MNIITAGMQDLPSLVKLFDAYRIFYRKASDKTGAETFLSQRIENNESVIFIAKNDNGESVGFTQLYPCFSSTRMQRVWILNDLFVDPTQRGKGISKLLIERAKQHCVETQGCGIHLETEKSNDIGNKLYPATDFELEQNNFYFWSVK